MRTAVAWVRDQIPYQHGRLVMITGADRGVGFQTARVLATRGAHVVLGCRDAGRGREAQRRINASGRDGSAEVVHLDTSDLAGVRRAAEQVRERHEHVDVLVNSAGVMSATPRWTANGSAELHLAANHLGHFALTSLLLPALLAGERPRVVTVSDAAYRNATIHFDDLNWERRYDPRAAYGQSRLANMLFTFELQRRCARAGLPLAALAADPGHRAPRPRASAARLARRPHVSATRRDATLSAQAATFGCLPVVAAAALPEAQGGDYWAPTGRRRPRGLPAPALPTPNTTDIAAARRLWTLSEELTGVTFEIRGRDVA